METLNIRYVDTVDRRVNIGKRKTRVAGFDLDVPNIRKFTFEGPCMPELCFSPSLGDQCVSDVSISNHGDLSRKWFYELSEFLTKLKGSTKVHLCIHLHSSKGYDYEAGKVADLNVCEVDDLTLDTKDIPSLSLYGFLDGLFRSCHPKMITQYISPPLNGVRGRGDDEAKTRHNDLLLYRSLEGGMQAKSVLLPTHFMYGLRNLEELEAQQLFDEVWEPQALGSISEQRRFRFRLKWKPSLDQYMRRPDDDEELLDDADDEYAWSL